MLSDSFKELTMSSIWSYTNIVTKSSSRSKVKNLGIMQNLSSSCPGHISHQIIKKYEIIVCKKNGSFFRVIQILYYNNYFHDN